MKRILVGSIALLFAVNAQAQEKVRLKAGVGLQTVESYCGACHSLDYPLQNVGFLNRQSWETEVNKMIKVFGAPIEPTDAKIIVDYLTTSYGSGK
ncbi:MAG: cytochrome c [Xanthobacteraceae bacterium]